MLNTIKMEIYSMLRSKYLRVLLCVAAVFSLAASIYFMAAVTDSSGQESLVSALWDSPTMIVLCAILCSFYIGNDFQNRVVSVQIATGHSRLQILLAKSVVFSLATIPLSMLYPLIRTLIFTVHFGWGEAFTGNELFFVLRAVSLSILLNVANSSVFVFFAFLFRNAGKTAACSIPFYMLVPSILALIGSRVPFVETFLQLTPYYLSREVANPDMLTSRIFVSVASSIITVLLVISVTFFVFRKRELK